MSDSEDPIDPVDDAGDDLFGDEDDDQITSPKERVLDDDDLASDREGDRYNRYDDDVDGQIHGETSERAVMAVQTYRHRIPKPQNGSLKILRVPKFVKLMPEVYDPETFQPTEFDLVNAKAERMKHVARVRRDAETGGLKSNTNIYRWSDGSVTISVGGEQYEISNKQLAPDHDAPYNEINDAHYYAAAAELSSNVLMVVGHVTEQYSIKPNKDVGDDALSVLAERMAQASKPAREGDFIVKTTIDPELQSRQIEAADKLRLKAQRDRENAAARMIGGPSRSRGGLSVGDLEGGRRAPGAGRKRGAGGAKPKRRNPEYDTDDEEGGIARQNDYDMADPFMARSDEEDEGESEVDDDEEEVLDDDEDERRPRRKRQRTEEDEDEDEDAEGDDVAPAESSRAARRRNVIDDDDEE